MIFGHNYLISELIFKLFVALFRTKIVAKRCHCHIFLVVFQKSEISKNAVSERWCSDNSIIKPDDYQLSLSCTGIIMSQKTKGG